jgi:hypothetical protein
VDFRGDRAWRGAPANIAEEWNMATRTREYEMAIVEEHFGEDK